MPRAIEVISNRANFSCVQRPSTVGVFSFPCARYRVSIKQQHCSPTLITTLLRASIGVIHASLVRELQKWRCAAIAIAVAASLPTASEVGRPLHRLSAVRRPYYLLVALRSTPCRPKAATLRCAYRRRAHPLGCNQAQILLTPNQRQAPGPNL